MSSSPSAPSPDITVVLVHGAFADASSWSGVLPALIDRGLAVVAPPNPLRGLTADSAYIASVLGQIDGPVLLVGHSYGGAVITNAATGATNVVGLVYVAAFVPDEGELLGQVATRSTESVLNTALVPRRYPGPAGQPATEFGIDPGRFHATFAADLPADRAVVLAAIQRPGAEATFTDPSGPPAWKRLPSWAVVGTQDVTIGADLVRSMAQRAGAEVVEVAGSHVIMLSRPDAVIEVIGRALGAVTQPAADLPAPRGQVEQAAETAT